MKDNKIEMEYFQLDLKSKVVTWPTWFGDALVGGKATFKFDGVVLHSDDGRQIFVPNGGYIMKNLSGGLARLDFIQPQEEDED